MELRKSVPRHRRSVSDPTELMPSLRLALAGEGKRQRSPSSRSPFADGPRKQKSAFDVIEDASMFDPGELFEEFGDYDFGTAAVAMGVVAAGLTAWGLYLSFGNETVSATPTTNGSTLGVSLGGVF